MYKHISTTIFTLVVSLGSANMSGAQEMLSLSAALEKGAAQAYGFERCAGAWRAGAWRAIQEWGGQSQWGEQYKEFDMQRTAMNVAAIVAHKEKGLSQKEAVGANRRAVENIYALYTERFRKNYASSGQAFGNDELVKSDVEACKVFVFTTIKNLDKNIKAAKFPIKELDTI